MGTKLVLPMQWSTATLVLKPSVLGARNFYQFDLRCGHLVKSVVVVPNLPPQNGRLHLSPSTGYEVKTYFMFLASNWTDKDLPLSYQFSYYTTVPNYQFVTSANARLGSSTSSLLPAGSLTSHYAINCSVQVFDFYAASSVQTGSVIVQPVSNKATQQFVVATINASSGGGGLSLSTVNLLGALLNKVNCTGSPNCAILFRNPCSSVARTCGSCLPGYLGEFGSRNSPCFSPSSLVARNSSELSQLKRCLYNCSGQGECMYVDSNSGQRLFSCDVLSTTCRAVCVCRAGYAGASCSLTKQDLEQKQRIRDVLLTSLLNLTHHSASSASAVTALASSLSLQTTNPDEISSDSSSAVVLNMANMLISGADHFQVPQEDFTSQLLSSIDAVSSVWNSSEKSPDDILKTLQSCVLFSSLQLYSSQDSINNLLSNFKTSVSTLSSATIAVPLSPLELFTGTRSSVVDVSDLLRDDFLLVQATRVGMVELKASLFATNSSSSYKSNPLVITYTRQRSLNLTVSLSRRRFISVTLVNNVLQPVENSTTLNFSTVCHRRLYPFSSLSHRYVCPFSGYVITHDCTRKVGVLTTTCPRYQPSCSSSVTSTKYSACELISFSMNATVCNCSLPEFASTIRRRLSSSGDILETASLQVVATGQYLTDQVGQTLSASPSLASPDTIQHVYVVISMFASLWVMGAALFAFGRRKRVDKSKISSDKTTTTTTATINTPSVVTPQNIHQEFNAYIEQVIPSIFRGESNMLKSFKELLGHHKYAALVYTDNLNLLNVSRIVTIQSMLMFILAVSYDLQSPSDDGSCLQWLGEETCLRRKSYLDSTQSYCRWDLLSTDDMGSSFSAYACSYQNPVPTVQEVLTISVIVSVFTALFLRPIDFIFKVLHAPISNRVQLKSSSKNNTKKKKKKVEDNESASYDELLKNHLISKVAGVQVRDISQSVISTRSVVRQTLYQSTSHIPTLTTMAEHKQSTGNPLARRARAAPNNQFSLTAADFSMTTLKKNLVMAINQQRLVLSGISLDEFDSQWGILRHTGMILARTQSNDLSDVLFVSGMFDKIYHDIENVRKRAVSKIEALRVTSEDQKGLEILHLFMMDLLGRRSPAAKIFESKLGEDFEETKVVKYNKKALAAAVLVTLNILFAYYSILYGSVRGESWQMMYLGACIAQFFIEIFINESLECVWLHHVVPMLAAREVAAAHRVLVGLVERFCSSESKTSPGESNNGSFNAPDYLFVSTNVAKAFPLLMESLIIQSYTTPLPGESAKQWRQSQWQRFLSHIHTPRSGNMLVRFSGSVLLTLFTLLEYGATTPYLLQKMFVRFCQPFLVSGIVLAFSMVIESPLYIALFFLSAMGAIMYANRRGLSKLVFVRRSVLVTPLIVGTTPVTSTTGSDGGALLLVSDEESSINYSISSESLVSVRTDPLVVDTNTHPIMHSSSDGEGSSFYSSLPDSSVGDSDIDVVIHGQSAAAGSDSSDDDGYSTP